MVFGVFNNKKAQTTSEDTIHLVLLFISLSILAFLFVMLISADSQGQYTISPGLEEKILVHRLLSSRSCFVYVDNVNRAYPAIIDYTRFNENNFKRCFDNEDNNYAYHVSLEVEFPEGTKKLELQTDNYNPVELDNENPPINVLVKNYPREEYFVGKFRVDYHVVSDR